MIKYIVTFCVAFVLGGFLTVQYQGTVNRTVARANRESNAVSQKAHDVAKELTK